MQSPFGTDETLILKDIERWRSQLRACRLQLQKSIQLREVVQSEPWKLLRGEIIALVKKEQAEANELNGFHKPETQELAVRKQERIRCYTSLIANIQDQADESFMEKLVYRVDQLRDKLLLRGVQHA